MIHFFLTFSRTAADSPFGRRLVEAGVRHRILSVDIRHRYKHRIWMALVGRPQTAWFAIKAAWQSLLGEGPAPRVVVVWTHIEALIVHLVRWLSFKRGTQIVLVGFILTERSGVLHRWLRRLYFRWVFSTVAMTVVHSSVEAARYAELFRGCGSIFRFIPWGSHIEGLEALTGASAPARPATGADVVCAGRSGRDYATLCRAFAGSVVQVHIVCDLAQALRDCERSPNIQVLDHCYGGDYLREVLRAHCVAVPLAVNEISAGQMVLLQAMEMGKAVVITRTSTTTDYATDGHDAVFVPPADPQALRTAVQGLLDDPARRERIGAQARQSFLERFTMAAFVDALLLEIGKIDPEAGRR